MTRPGTMQAAVLHGAPDLMRKGGSIAVIGLPEDDAVTYRMNTVVDKELTIRGVFGFANTYPAGIRLVASGRYPVERAITDRLPLAETLQAFDLATEHKDGVIKVNVNL